MNAPELGDSEGGRRRTDTVRGASVLARVKRCESGFNTFEGIEWLMDGVKPVGGSYLMHMRKILYPFTGIFLSCLKMSVNRSKPRPLLVVHSGNTTTGPCARVLTSSKLSCFSLLFEVWMGILPVWAIMDQIETTLKPRTFA